MIDNFNGMKNKTSNQNTANGQASKITRFLHSKYAFWCGIGLFLIVFALTRLCFYTNINLPYSFDDAPSYTQVIDTFLEEGKLEFTQRSPGYPLFLLLSYTISPNISMVLILQSVLTILSGIFIIWAFFKTYTKLALPAAIALSVFISSTVYLHHESAILTESLYTSLFLFFSGFLMLALQKHRLVYWCMTGLLVMPIIFVKPIGVILFAFVGLLILYMVIRHFKWEIIVAFGLPIIILYLTLAFYNLYSLGDFTINESHGKKFLALVHPVLTSLEQDEDYPEEINGIIEDLQEKIPESHKKLVATSWNLKKLRLSHLQNKKHFRAFIENYRALDTDFSLRTVSLDAIKKHPGIYGKWFITMITHYFRSFNPDLRYTYPFLQNHNKCFTARIRRYFYDDANKQGRFMYYYTPKLTVRETQNKLEALRNNNLCVFNQKFSKFHNTIFQSLIWVYIYVFVLLFAAIKFFTSKLRDTDSFVVLLILLLPLASGISYAVVHGTFIRYSYPLSFAYYLAPVFLPLLLPQGLFKRYTPVKQNRKKKKK